MRLMRIKKGDSVVVIAGKDKGKTGTVAVAFPRANKVIVEGVNVRKRHQKGTRRNQKGQIVEVEHPVHVSNVQLRDPKSEAPTRIGMLVKEDGSKARVAKKSKVELTS